MKKTKEKEEAKVQDEEKNTNTGNPENLQEEETKDEGATGEEEGQAVENQPEENGEDKSTEKAEEETDAEKLARMHDKYLRLSAEFDNYRKRTLKEKMELTRLASEEILKNLLPVVDDFERAVKSMEETNDADAVRAGVDLIFTKFKDFMNNNGVKEIEALDKEFDADLHEAITKVPVKEEEKKGKVVDIIEKGYYLQDKIIRYAKVVVGE
jgi:molecular chaperone GrpE